MRILEQEVLLSSSQTSESARIRTETVRMSHTRTTGDSFLTQLAARMDDEPERERQTRGRSPQQAIREMKARIIQMVLEAYTCRGKGCCRGPKSSEARQVTQSRGKTRSARVGGTLRVSMEIATRDIKLSRQTCTVDAGGTVKLEDGRTISFALRFEVARSEFAGIETSLRVQDDIPTVLADNEEVVVDVDTSVSRVQNGVDVTDPLVVCFTGQYSQLDDTQIRFDLDGDGTMEQFPQLADGSWFLALDRNRNGRIDDGTELFGPQTGNGFGELRQFDGDGNGWIDENDPVFGRLSLWRPGEQSGPALPGADVGAIHTGAVEGLVQLDNSAGAFQGRLREHGVWLRESNGAPGFIHEMDLRV